jgi:putative transposase
MGELLLGLSKYFVMYNGDRPHQALGNKTPGEVYQSASGGGAMIVDKYGAKEGLPVALRCSGTAFRKDSLEKDIRNRIQKPGQRRAAA